MNTVFPYTILKFSKNCPPMVGQQWSLKGPSTFIFLNTLFDQRNEDIFLLWFYFWLEVHMTLQGAAQRPLSTFRPLGYGLALFFMFFWISCRPKLKVVCRFSKDSLLYKPRLQGQGPNMTADVDGYGNKFSRWFLRDKWMADFSLTFMLFKSSHTIALMTCWYTGEVHLENLFGLLMFLNPIFQIIDPNDKMISAALSWFEIRRQTKL